MILIARLSGTNITNAAGRRERYRRRYFEDDLEEDKQLLQFPPGRPLESRACDPVALRVWGGNWRLVRYKMYLQQHIYQSDCYDYEI